MIGPDELGYWRADIAEAEPGSDYAYCIDDDPTPYPDPRSQWQPQGVHGPSRIYDQNAFVWNDDGFQHAALVNAIIYELHIGTFTPSGTLDGAIEKLDYLNELGITHINLMPVAAFAGDHGWGYDGVALFAVHQPYGGPDALKRFVDAAHDKGLAVLLDVVYNHFGPVGNYTAKFGPYTTDAHRTPWGGAANLEDSGAFQVRRFFCDNALMWLRDFHIDGLRIDAVHAFVDRSAIHFLEQLSAEVEALAAVEGRYLVLIAESDLNDPRVVTSREHFGLGMHAQWSDDFHHALFTILNPGETHGYYLDFGEFGQLVKAMKKTFVYDGIYSRHRGRVHGKPVGNLSQRTFLGFIQNHDQIGNRAVGDRLFENVGMDRAKIGAALVLMGPFIPMLFQGEEWAASSPFQYFADHDDPAMARLVSEGRKREFVAFGWNAAIVPDPEAEATFERSKLKWDELASSYHAELLQWYRQLIRIRKVYLNTGQSAPLQARLISDGNEQWMVLINGELNIFCNLGRNTQKLAAPPGGRILLTSSGDIKLGNNSITLPPDSLAVVK